MRMSKSVVWTLAFFVALSAAAAHAVNIKTVRVSNPGNAPDPSPSTSGDCCFGSVAYVYRIGKFEVTNSQYAEFLNSVDPTGTNVLELYIPSMDSSPQGGITLNGAASDGSKYHAKTGQDNNPV